jgi:hypothetical protein
VFTIDVAIVIAAHIPAIACHSMMRHMRGTVAAGSGWSGAGPAWSFDSDSVIGTSFAANFAQRTLRSRICAAPFGAVNVIMPHG